MLSIGKINLNKIGKYKYIIRTTEVILTEERRKHIYNNHIKDYERIINNLEKAILNPIEILEDCKNKNTLLFIGRVEKHYLNVIIKCSDYTDSKHIKNSIMTAWIIRESNLKKLRNKNRIIYKKE